MGLNKKNYICPQPFEFAEIFDHKMYMCCPNWLPVDLGNPNTIKENWEGEKAEEVRKSILDGSYKYCIESRCPKLTGLKEGKTEGLIKKEDFVEDRTLKSLKFNFDQSCNLKCPSCRNMFINYEGKDRERTEELIKHIEEQLGKGIERIECTGSGDPFFSRSFRKWMMNFNPQKYPSLRSMHLHTNGTLWNHSNWSRMKNIHPFVTSAEISIDAATKDTYENKTRIGGKWEKIIENLHYIANLPQQMNLTLSFVLQQQNYKEMVLFYNLIESIFSSSNKEWSIFFNRVVNWGTYTEEQFEKTDIGNPNHPEYFEFLKIYNQLPTTYKIRHNLDIQLKQELL